MLATRVDVGQMTARIERFSFPGVATTGQTHFVAGLDGICPCSGEDI